MASTEQNAKIISDQISALIDKYEADIIANARSNPASVFKIPQSEIDDILDSVVAIGDDAVLTIETELSSFGSAPNVSNSGEAKDYNDNVTKFYVQKSLDDAVNSIHSSTIARQIDDKDRQEAINKSTDNAKKRSKSTILAEVGATYALLNDKISIDSNQIYYEYLTSEDDVVRNQHDLRNKKLFVRGLQRSVDDVPQLANSCRCSERRITEDEAKERAGDFFYPSDAPRVTAMSSSEKIVARRNEKKLALDIVGYIDDWDGNDFVSIRNKLDSEAINGEDITINVTSDGGFADDGLHIYDYINQIKKTHGIKVNVNVVGSARSAATPLLAAADKSTITPNGKILLHRPYGGIQGDFETFENKSKELKDITLQYANIYAEKTNKSVDYIMDLMAKDIDLTAQEAVDLGIVDEIVALTNDESRIFASYSESNLNDDGDSEMTDKLQKELDELKSKYNDLESSMTAKDETIKALEKQASQKSEDEIRAEVKAELIENQAKLKLAGDAVKAAEIEAIGDTVDEIYANALKQIDSDIDTDKLNLEGKLQVFAYASKNYKADRIKDSNDIQAKSLNEEKKDDSEDAPEDMAAMIKNRKVV